MGLWEDITKSADTNFQGATRSVADFGRWASDRTGIRGETVSRALDPAGIGGGRNVFGGGGIRQTTQQAVRDSGFAGQLVDPLGVSGQRKIDNSAGLGDSNNNYQAPQVSNKDFKGGVATLAAGYAFASYAGAGAGAAAADTQAGSAVEVGGDTYSGLVSDQVTTEPLYLDEGYGAVQVEGGQPLATESVTSSDLTLDSGVMSAPGPGVGGAPAATGKSYLDYLGYGALGVGALTGNKGAGGIINDLGGLANGDPGTQGWWNQLAGIGQDTSTSADSRSPAAASRQYLTPNDGTSTGPLLPQSVASVSILTLGALAIGAYFMAKQFKVI